MEWSDEVLINQCLKNNPLAQRTLYDKYSKKFFAICLRYCKYEEDAQDILQNGFIKIFTKLDTFNHSGSFEGWMKRIITNTAIEFYRKNINFQDIEDIHVQNDNAIIETSTIDLDTFLKIIQKLPDGYRIVFNMYAIEGFNHKEIAQKLNISEGTSKSQLSRARAILQKKIEELNHNLK